MLISNLPRWGAMLSELVSGRVDPLKDRILYFLDTPLDYPRYSEIIYNMAEEV